MGKLGDEPKFCFICFAWVREGTILIVWYLAWLYWQWADIFYDLGLTIIFEVFDPINILEFAHLFIQRTFALKNLLILWSFILFLRQIFLVLYFYILTFFLATWWTFLTTLRPTYDFSCIHVKRYTFSFLWKHNLFLIDFFEHFLNVILKLKLGWIKLSLIKIIIFWVLLSYLFFIWSIVKILDL